MPVLDYSAGLHPGVPEPEHEGRHLAVPLPGDPGGEAGRLEPRPALLLWLHQGGGAHAGQFAHLTSFADLYRKIFSL